jgi:hypothetical protein
VEKIDERTFALYIRGAELGGGSRGRVQGNRILPFKLKMQEMPLNGTFDFQSFPSHLELSPQIKFSKATSLSVANCHVLPQ